MTHVDLGSTPPQIQGIKFHDFTGDSVIIDLELRLVADSSSSIVANVVCFGMSLPVMLRHVNFIATLRIEMRSIRGSLPCFDELHISFARKPKFEFDLAAGHKTFDLAHLPIVDRAIMDTVGMVLGWYVEFENIISLSHVTVNESFSLFLSCFKMMTRTFDH